MKRTVLLPLVSLTLTAAVAGCEADPDDVPEMAEVDTVEGEIEYDDVIVLSEDEVGETLLATGLVSGAPVNDGFFLITDHNRVIFVQTDEQVSPGEEVRVVGPLVQTQATVFQGWQQDAYEGSSFEADWSVENRLFIDATTVERIQ